MSVSMFLVPLAVVALLMVPFVPALSGCKTKKTAKRGLIINLCGFFGICGLAVILPFGGMASAAEAATTAAAAGSNSMGFLAAALATGLSSIGAGIAVAAAAPAAIGAFSENAKNFGKSLIFVALGEGVALYGLLVSILLINKL